MKAIHIIALTLVLVGGINWGLIGLFNYDLVRAIFGTFSGLIFTLVGVSAIVLIFTHKKDCKTCGTK